VAAWQANTISRDTMLDLFRRGEVLPEGRTNEEEAWLIGRIPEAARQLVRHDFGARLNLHVEPCAQAGRS
jgi:hypothetical protein